MENKKHLNTTRDFFEIIDALYEYQDNGGEVNFEIEDFEALVNNRQWIKDNLGIDNPILDGKTEALACLECAKKVPLQDVAFVDNTRWSGYEGYHNEGFCSDCYENEQERIAKDYGLE